jgi:hypothetical protein
LALSELGAAWLDESTARTLTVLAGDARLFRLADLISVLRAVRLAGTMSLDDISEAGTEGALLRLTRRAAAARLLKLGALSQVGRASDRKT